jgi:hypothetical protein
VSWGVPRRRKFFREFGQNCRRSHRADGGCVPTCRAAGVDTGRRGMFSLGARRVVATRRDDARDGRMHP